MVRFTSGFLIEELAKQEITMIGRLLNSILGSTWRGFACLTELSIPTDNPAWAKAAFEVELSDSPKPYSPIILSNFNEEEYINQPSKEGGEEDPTKEGVKPRGKQQEKELVEMLLKTSFPIQSLESFFSFIKNFSF